MTRALLPPAVLAALLAACPPASSAPDAGPAFALNTVATVNGVKLTELELQLRMKTAGMHGESAPEKQREAALDALITQELMAQRAKELGLDRDPGFLAVRAQLEAQKAELERRELAQLFEEKEVRQKAQVTEAQARAYFEKNRAKLSERLYVSQLLVVGREKLEPLKKRIDSGESFDAVVGSFFPPRPGTPQPWKLGPLSWQQVPEPWWPVLDKLKVGEVSDIIDGPAGRAWLVRLDARNTDDSLTFEKARPSIEAVLKSEALTVRHAELIKSLEAKAQILRGGGK